MNRNRREHRAERQRTYSADSRERRLAARRPARSDVARALLLLFLDSAARAGATPSESLIDRLVDAGFSADQSRDAIASLVGRHDHGQC